MNINHQEFFKPVTKATFRLDRSNVAEVMEAALRISTECYPGPVHIGLPAGISDIEVEVASPLGLMSENQYFHNNFQKIISILERSRRPIMAIGLTAARLDLKEKLLSFLDEYPMPVVLTPMAKEVIPMEHPCYTGVLFHSLSDLSGRHHLRDQI